jgi:hypothetical protein
MLCILSYIIVYYIMLCTVSGGSWILGDGCGLSDASVLEELPGTGRVDKASVWSCEASSRVSVSGSCKALMNPSVHYLGNERWNTRGLDGYPGWRWEIGQGRG